MTLNPVGRTLLLRPQPDVDLDGLLKFEDRREISPPIHPIKEIVATGGPVVTQITPSGTAQDGQFV